MDKLVWNPNGVRDLLNGAETKAMLMDMGHQVAAEAQATADAAQNGAGGTIDGYSQAGFKVTYDDRQMRPRVLISSNADPEIVTAVHFHTQKRDGVAHLRAALYKITRRG